MKRTAAVSVLSLAFGACAVFFVGCAAQIEPAITATDPYVNRPSWRTLQRLADREATQQDIVREELLPDDFAVIATDNTTAWFTLEAAIADLASKHSIEIESASVDIEPTDEDRLAAARSYSHGRLAMREGETTEAAALFRQATRLDPFAAAAWRELGNISKSQGNTLITVASFERARAIDQSDPAVNEQLAIAWAMQGQEAKAALLLAEILEGARAENNATEIAVTHWRLASVLESLSYLGASNEAILIALGTEVPSQSLGVINALKRSQAELWAKVADTRIQLGDLAGAINAYQNATDEPASVFPEAKNKLIRALRAGGRDHSAALGLLQQLEASRLRSTPELRNQFSNLTESSVKPHLIHSAIDEIAQTLDATESRLAKADVLLLNAAIQRDSEGELEVLLRDSSPLAPRRVRARIFELAHQLGPKEVARAADVFAGYPTTKPHLLAREIAIGLALRADETRAIIEKCSSLAMVGELSLLLGDAEQARFTLKEPPRSPSEWLSFGRIAHLLESSNDLELAIDQLDRDSESDPHAAIALARLQEIRRRYFRSYVAYTNAFSKIDLERQPELGALILAERAGIERTLGEHESALDSVNQAIELNPTLDIAHAERVRTLGIIGADTSDIRAAFLDAQRVNPQSTTVRILRVTDALRAGRVDLAEQMLTEIDRDDPSHIEALASLTVIRSQNGAAAKGLTEVEERLKRTPGDPQLLLARTQLLSAEQRSAEAFQGLIAWQSLIPGDLEAHEAMYRFITRDDPTTTRAAEALNNLARRLTELDAAMLRLDHLVNQNPRSHKPQTIAHILEVLEEVSQHSEGIRHKVIERHIRHFIHSFDWLATDQNIGQLAPLQRRGLNLLSLPTVADLEVFYPVQVHGGVTAGDLLDHAEEMTKRGITDSYRALLDAAYEVFEEQRSIIRNSDAPPRVPSASTLAAIAEKLARTQRVQAIDAISKWLLAAHVSRNGEMVYEALLLADSLASLNELYLSFPIPDSLRTDLVDWLTQHATAAAEYTGQAPQKNILMLALREDPDHANTNNSIGYMLLENREKLGLAAACIVVAYEEGFRNEEEDPNGHIIDSYGWLLYRAGVFEADDQAGAVQVLRESIRVTQREAIGTPYSISVLRD
ncbi:MAG: tetratricopeptide repeat protein, partial [Planctomycetota bacterium]